MKTIEEKAKRYDESLEKARKLKDEYNDIEGYYPNQWLCEELFPELKESEDERIRKELIEYIKDQQSSFISAPDCRDKYEEEENNKYNSWIAWLEKQCSQILANSAKTCKDEQKPVDFSDLRTWKYIVDAVWTEKEGIGQYLDSPFTEEVAKKLQKRFGKIEQKPAEWTADDEEELKIALNTLEEAGQYSSAKWLKNVCLVPQTMQKHAWSEEDEEHIKRIIEHFEGRIKDLKTQWVAELHNKEITWLKSLKDRYTWKPSEEQMDALHYVTNFDYGGHKATLVSLYEQLKKLKG